LPSSSACAPTQAAEDDSLVSSRAEHHHPASASLNCCLKRVLPAFVPSLPILCSTRPCRRCSGLDRRSANAPRCATADFQDTRAHAQLPGGKSVPSFYGTLDVRSRSFSSHPGTSHSPTQRGITTSYFYS